MIKKILSLGVLLLSFVSVTYGYGEWVFHDVTESFSVQNASSFTLRVVSSSAGVLDGGGMTSPKPLILLQANKSSSEQYRYIYFWGKDSKLYAYGNSAGSQSSPSGLEYLRFDKFYRFSNTDFTHCDYSSLHSCSYSEEVNSESFYTDTALKNAMTQFAYFDYNGNNNYTAFCWVYGSLGFSICVKPSGASTTDLTPVAGLSLDPVEFDSDRLVGISPWVSTAGNNGNGGVSSSISFTVTGDVVTFDCTYNDVLTALETEGRNKYMCYGGLDNFNLYDSSLSYSPIPGTGKSIVDIWAWNGSRAWDNFTDWYWYWDGLYGDDTYNAMWESYPAVYHTFFQLNRKYRQGSTFTADTLLQYCQIINFTGDTLNASVGGYFKPLCTSILQEKQNGVRQKRLDGTLYSGQSVPVSVNWDGVGLLSGVEQQSSLTFIQNFFNKIKGTIPDGDSVGSGNGIIPWYITGVLLCVIFFRFLRK